MTKIRPVLLCLLLFSPLSGFGQAANESNSVSSAFQSSPVWESLTNEVRMDRQPVFIVHRLIGQVELEKRRPYEPSIKGRPVSLPCPTPCQPRRQPC